MAGAEGLDKLEDWLAKNPASPFRIQVIEWVAWLVANEREAEEGATPVPSCFLPTFAQIVPGTDVAVTWFRPTPFYVPVLVRVEARNS